jgi:molybdopterin-guanine dinucleotide biosynthesis protein A
VGAPGSSGDGQRTDVADDEAGVDVEGAGAAYDVVVLAGGSARRLGGIDKVLLPVAGRPLLERVVAAAGGGRTVTVVGPRRVMAGAEVPIQWVREDPPGSGPLAALAAGARDGAAPVVVVLAADMPFVDADVVARLVLAASADGMDGAVVVDGADRPQPLAAAYQRTALDEALTAIGDPADRPVRLLLPRLRLAHVPDPRAALDCDTADDLAAADRLASANSLAAGNDRRGR